MTDATYDGPKVSLGAGNIIGDTFSILFRKLPAILLLGFFPALVEVILGYQLPVGESDFGSYPGLYLITILVNWVISGVVTAAIVQLSYDARLNRPSGMGGYIAVTIRYMPAIVALSVVSSLLITLGVALFVIPGLWIYAVYSVVVPAIVIEGAGFGALGRSAELTRGYRWPVVAVLIVVVLCVILNTVLVSAVVRLVPATFPGSVFGLLVLEAAGNALSFGLFSITVALIFARLKEIKEGVGVADLVEVFR